VKHDGEAIRDVYDCKMVACVDALHRPRGLV